jgi:cation:H+ antiporter
MPGVGFIAAGTPTAVTALAFGLAAVVSLGASAVLVTRLERVGERLGLSEAMLGLGAALAADAPEITAAATALVRGERTIGVGVILGSNVFNLAALLGLSAMVAGRIRIHRRVVVFAGSVAVWFAVVGLGTAAGVPAGVGLTLALVVFVPYVFVSAVSLATLVRLPLPPRAIGWLHVAVIEEESELSEAIHPERGDWRDAVAAGVALMVVVVASVVMESAASSLGSHFGVSEIVVGAVVLAGVTSLPNAVAALYLGWRGRGAALLSEALNSNNLNVLLGLLVPATILGLGTPSAPVYLAAGFYAGLTVVALILAYWARGLGRAQAAVVIAAYVAFVALLVWA